jgi:hypothetical protein
MTKSVQGRPQNQQRLRTLRSYITSRDTIPAQARLCAFQNHKLEQTLVVVYGNAPLFVMILERRRVCSDPGATNEFFGAAHRQTVLGVDERSKQLGEPLLHFAWPAQSALGQRLESLLCFRPR